MGRFWLHGRAITSGGVVERALVEVEAGRIAAVWDLDRQGGPAGFAAARAAGRLSAGTGWLMLPDGEQVAYVHVPGGWICPGFIDLHVHGGGGAEFMDGTPEAVEAVCRFHAGHGTTGLLATTWTAPADAILGAIRRVRSSRCWAGRGEAAADCPGAPVLGVHVEGPFINPAFRGAQDPRHIRLPDVAEAEGWLAAGGGPAAAHWLMTIAPELPGAPELIRRLAGQGVLVNAGHTGCSYAELAAGVAAGVSGITHTFNAMTPLHHREPGCVGGALTMDGLACELIGDGIHVHPAAMRLLVRARDPQDLILITDAVRAAGLPDGDYELGGSRVRVAEGAVRLAEGGALAGSSLTMDRAVGILVEQVGLPAADAVNMASLNPARRLGLAHRKGQLAPGMDADIAVLDGQWQTRLTLVGGRVVYQG